MVLDPFTPPILTLILGISVGVGLVAVVLYLVVRFAVRAALRDHQLWLIREDRASDVETDV